MNETNAWIDALRGTPQMKEVPAEGVEQLARVGVAESCPKGTLLFREGDRARALHFLASGSVEVRRSIGSIEVRVAHIRAPFWLGEAGLLEASNRTFSAHVVDDATVVAFPCDPLLAAAAQSPHVQAALASLVGERLRGRARGVRVSSDSLPQGTAPLPAFLSVLAGRADAGATPRERLRAVVDGFEALLRYLRGILVAHTLRDRRGDAIEERMIALLEKGSLADLLAHLVEGAKHHAQKPQGFFMPELCTLLAAEEGGAENVKALETLLAAHAEGVPAGDDDAARALESAGPVFRKVLSSVAFLAEYPLYEFTGMEYRRGKFVYRAEKWMGSATPFRPEVVEFVAPLEVSRVYVTRRNAERLLGLFPWLLRISCAECGAPHLFLATEVEGGLVGYVDFLTGHRLRLREVKEEFEFIASQLRGKSPVARKGRPTPSAAMGPQRGAERPPASRPPASPTPPTAAAPPAPPAPAMPKATVEELLAQAHSTDAATREQAVQLLGREVGAPLAPDVRVKQALLDALADAFPGARRAAAESLGYARCAGTGAALLPLLKDSIPYVRRMAAWAIAEVGAAEESATLGEALVASLSDPTTVQFAERALAKLGSPGQKRGTMTWYDPARGYGFANVEGKHVFVPAASLEHGFVPKANDLFCCYVVEEPKGPRGRLARKFEQSPAEAEALTRTGTVKWYDPGRGFGFLRTDQGEDVFAHVSALSGDTITTGLLVGQRVKFRMQAAPKGLRASNIEVISGPPPTAAAPAAATPQGTPGETPQASPTPAPPPPEVTAAPAPVDGPGAATAATEVAAPPPPVAENPQPAAEV